MCGILLCVTNKLENNGHVQHQVTGDKCVLDRRGPDTCNEIQIELSNTLSATFSGYTLWLQGVSPTTQPQIDTSGNILLWNGDAFYNQIDGESIPEGLSDTEFLFKKLEKTITVEEICKTLETIKGPWSLIYYKKVLNVIITGRDRFGRHSLLWNRLNNENNEFSCPLIITSSSQAGCLCEVPASNLYQISFSNSISVEKVYRRKPYVINKNVMSPNEPNLPLSLLENKKSYDPVIKDYLINWKKEVEEFKKILLESIKSRIQCQPMLCKSCVQFRLTEKGSQHNQCSHSKIAILFSGGLDSSVLAALTDIVWPENESIDLCNVAFPLRTKSSSGEKFDVPDRLTGLQALEELQKINPSRKWNFIEVNVELEELVEMRKSRIAALIHPASTVLDDSIGCAQWFAARGEGYLFGTNKKYLTPARVVLMGAGADEQMAGYARHRQRFDNGGWTSLVTEIEMEMNRISERNLGRDNRIIADHGRAPRLPFLDEGVVEYLAQLPILAKADLRLPIGLGDKIILRALAHSLGLNKTATEPKRAIQFGSRIAKTEARKEKGSQICDRLTKTLVTID